jgi:ADP-ribosyl-[dinitrogen reductase] hydrolase
MRDKFEGALVGLAVGDAVGTTLEFKPRGTFNPITDMEGGGPFRLRKGEWTDDTSMALCLTHSLLTKKGFDPEDQMNRYCNWWRVGYMSSTGDCFDIGGTVMNALDKYIEHSDPFSGSIDEDTAGNGSLMRLAPIPIFYSSDRELAVKYAGESSRTTHGAAECIDSCRLFADLILEACRAGSKEAIFEKSSYEPYTPRVIDIANRDFLSKSYDELTGSGYVIESLESALWCFMNSESFEEAILLSANLGNDADTTAAICGQIAGAYYGFSGIPEKWSSAIVMANEIREWAGELATTGKQSLTEEI